MQNIVDDEIRDLQEQLADVSRERLALIKGLRWCLAQNYRVSRAIERRNRGAIGEMCDACRYVGRVTGWAKVELFRYRRSKTG